MDFETGSQKDNWCLEMSTNEAKLSKWAYS